MTFEFYRKDFSDRGKVYRITWYLRGPKGVVQLQGLVLPASSSLRKIYADGDLIPVDGGMLLPSDLGYHSPVPLYEGQEPIDDDCEVIGGTCYYEGSSLPAQRPFKRWQSSGYNDSVIRERLERAYSDFFANP